MRYNNPITPADQLREFFLRGGVPVTTFVLVANAVTFLAAFFAPPVYQFLAQWVACEPLNALRTPWTLLTYPLAFLDTSTTGLWNFLFVGFFFWSWGGSLERSWGSSRYGKLFFALAAISALFVVIGSYVLGVSLRLFGFFLPLAGITVAFCTLRPEEMVSFIIFPVRAKYLAWIAVLFTLVAFGQFGKAMLGVFGCGGLLVAYLYARYGRDWADVGSYAGGGGRRRTRGPDLRISDRPAARPSAPRTYMDGSPTRRSPLDLSGRWRDYQERRRLEKLWKNSGFSNSEPERRDDEERRRR